MPRSPRKSNRRPSVRGQLDVGKRLVLVVSHASNALPYWLRDLETSPLWKRLKPQHWAFDRGADLLGQELADRLKATVVFGEVSRLAIDLNRDLANESIIPQTIPGVGRLDFNAAAKAPDLSARKLLHESFHEQVERQLGKAASAGSPLFLIDLHSFDRFGPGATAREVDIGICVPGRPGFALAILDELKKQSREREPRSRVDVASGLLNVRLDEPYSAEHPGAYVTRRHAEAEVYGAVIEVCDELLASEKEVQAVASLLCLTVSSAVTRIDNSIKRAK